MDQKTIAINMMVTGPFPAQMAANGAAVQTFGNQAHAGMAKAGTSMQRFGQRATKVATVGVLAAAAGLALAAKAAIDFESSFTGIRKTVETSEEGFRMLALGIREMATEIPIGVNELNRIGELGGQLGVDPGDLLDFIDVIAKIGVTTTLSTETAAMGFARIDNIMQLGGKSFDRIGASIVDLGNNFAATEDEILTFSLRIAPIGATVGLVADEVLAISTAFTSVGVPAERGGTAIQKTFIKISEAVQNGGQELDVFARTAGMASDEFAELFESDPAEAFTLFVEGLGDIREEGGNVFAVLDSVELSNQRVISSLLAAANATGVLRDALDLSAKAWGDNAALEEEAQKRFETTESNLILLKNRVQDYAITVGSAILPAVNTFIDGLSTIVDWFKELDVTMQAAIIAIPIFVAAMVAAFAHPAVAGVAAAAVLVYGLGVEMHAAAAETEVMRKAVKALEGDVDSQALKDYFTIGGIDTDLLESNLGKIGLTMDDFAEAVSGTDEEWDTFFNNFKDKQLDAGGLVMPLAYLEQVRRAWEDANEWVVMDTAKSIAEADAMEEQFINDMKARREQINAELESGDTAKRMISPAVIDDKFLKDIDSMLGDYVEVFTDAFDETDERIRGQISLWYEFGDAVEINVEELIPNLMRQIEAVQNFETLLSELNLSAAAEQFIRESFDTPTLMEGLVEFRENSIGEFYKLIFAAEGLMGSDGVLAGVVTEVFERRIPDLEFAAGADMLAAMSAVVDEIMNDPENQYDAAEVWLGVIQETLIRGGPDVAPSMIEALEAIFGAGGIPGVDLTIEEIEELLRLIGLLPESKTIEVDYILTYSERGRVPEPLMGYVPDTADYPTVLERGRAMGGSVFAGEPYIVGERGQELFIPFVNGTIIPNNKLDGLGGSTKNIEVNVIRPETNDLAGDISEGLTRASISEQVDLIGVY